VIADGAGRAVAFALAPGQAHELPHAIPLLARLPGVPVWVVADRGYSSHAFRQHVWDLGARPAIPPKTNEAPVACPAPIYGKRPFWALLSLAGVNVLGRSGAGSFRTTLWIALRTTRRVADIAGSRF
jgi:hypothetical protein